MSEERESSWNSLRKAFRAEKFREITYFAGVKRADKTDSVYIARSWLQQSIQLVNIIRRAYESILVYVEYINALQLRNNQCTVLKFVR